MLVKVKTLDGWNGLAELYLLNHQYVVISTITEADRPTDPIAQAWTEMTEALSIIAGPDVLPSHGEETIAFNADAEGNVAEHYPHLAIATGEGSREKVIHQLQNEE